MLGQKYYQHYFTVLDVPLTGYYTLTILNVSQNNKLLYVDGEALTLTSGQTQVYLRTGLHSVYLRLYADGADNINAFRMKIDGLSAEHDFKAYVPHHGRMTAVYYDSEHMGRLMDIDSPSYYTDPAAMLDKANVLMATTAIGGMKVVLDADDLLSYMLRDINSGGFDSGGHSFTPLYEAAGSVIMSSDAVPDTIYKGEYSNSIVERYLEMSGYFVTDGNVPFYMSTHKDGTSTVWPRGPAYVLDLGQTTDDAWFHADDAITKFGPKEVQYEGLFEETSASPELWADSYKYEFPTPGTAQFNGRQRVQLHSREGFSDYPFGLQIWKWTGGYQEDWMPLIGGAFTDTEVSKRYRTVFAPGATKLEIQLTVPLTLEDVRITLGPLRIDGYYVWNSTPISTLLGDDLTVFDTPMITETDSVKDVPFTLEFDLSHFDVLYETFVERLEFEILVEKKDSGSIIYDSRPFSINKVSVSKEFMVRTNKGIDEGFAMTLPIIDTGQLIDMRLSRYILPSHDEQAANYIEESLDRAQQGPWYLQENQPLWDDTVKAEILDYTLQSATTVTLKTTPSLAKDVYASSMTSQPMLGEVDFKDDQGEFVNPASWRVKFNPTFAAASRMTAVGFYWQVRPYKDSYYTNSRPSSLLFRHWMPQTTVTLQRTLLGSHATPTGSMIVGGLENYEPLWSIDTDYLRQNDRKFIEYGTWSAGPQSVFANPVSFQADSYGGGVITFGLSQMITQEHAWFNVSISEAYMDYLAKDYHMNLWGHTPLKNVVSAVNLDYSVEDRLELWNQEGYLDEAYGMAMKAPRLTAYGGGGAYYTPGTFSSYTAPTNPYYSLASSAYDSSPFRPAGMDDATWERLGNGQLDSFIEKTAVDYDGADWYSEDQYRANTAPDEPDWELVTDTIRMDTDTMLVRPSLSETSDWDSDDPTFDLFAPGIEWAKADGTILRHQLLRGHTISLDLNWSGLASGTPVYVTVQVQLAGVPYWVNRTMTSDDTSLTIDLKQLTNRLRNETAVPLWISDNRTLTTVPVVTMWVYRDNPTNITDIVSTVRNLLYADIFYLRMEYDDNYLSRYYAEQQRLGAEGRAMKKWLVIMGAAMVIVGALTIPFGGGGMVVWGADMIISTHTGQSMFDWIAKGIMQGANFLTGGSAFDENYIGNFSIWQMTSNKGWNLILSEAFAGLISFGIGKVSGRIAGSLAGSSRFGRLGEFANTLLKEGTEEAGEAAGMLARAWSKVTGRVNVLEKLTKRVGSNTALRIVGKGLGEYFELVGEVIFEMSFDNMLRFNKDERPMGGGQVFLITMTLSVTVSGMLQGIGKFDIGVKAGKKLDWSDITMNRKAVRVATKALLVTTLALAMAMYVMRMPVMAASAA